MMKRFIAILLMATTVDAEELSVSNRCAYSDNTSSDFLGITYLVSQYYVDHGSWPSSWEDLQSLKLEPTQLSAAIQKLKQTFSDVSFSSTNGMGLVALTYDSAQHDPLKGTITIPPGRTADAMIQDATAQGDLRTLIDEEAEP